MQKSDIKSCHFVDAYGLIQASTLYSDTCPLQATQSGETFFKISPEIRKMLWSFYAEVYTMNILTTGSILSCSDKSSRVLQKQKSKSKCHFNKIIHVSVTH